MMNKIKIFRNISMVMISLLILMVFSSCFFGTGVEKTVTPTIRAIGLPAESIIDSVTLKVTGPDMDPVEVSYSQLPNEINIAIPKGNNMTFELTVETGSAYIGTIATFSGTATVDINTDGAVVTLNMGIGSTKIIVPNPMGNSEDASAPIPRVLQFDDISNTTPIELNLVALQIQGLTGDVSTFNPYDIDFDNQGRIYIANYNPSTSSGIIRIDNILGTNPFFIATNHDTHGISIDRDNKVIYYFEGSSIESCDLNGNYLGNIYEGESAEAFTFYDGFLYISEMGDIIKHNISTGENINITIPQLSNPKDILVKGNKLYIANMEEADGYQILELSTSDLSFIASYGNYVSSVSTTKEDFYGPRRFVAQMNNEITIIDDSPDYQLDKIIQMDNIKGDNWNTLPGSDPGQDLFKFFDDNAGE